MELSASQAPDTPTPPPLTLEKTQLSLEDGILIKRNASSTVARHPLDAVESVEVSQRIDPFAVFFTVLVALVAVAAKRLVPNPNWGLLASIVLSVIALLLLTGIRSTVLKIRTRHGEVSYGTLDPLEQVSGFALTVRDEMERRHGARKS